MSDVEFLAGFASGTLAEFHHRDHLRMTWLLLRRDGLERGTRSVIDGIKRFAAAKRAPGRYHETLTRVWIHLVATAMDGTEQCFDDLLRGHPELLRQDQALRFYRPETLDGADARESWVEPDLAPLPAPRGAPRRPPAPPT